MFCVRRDIVLIWFQAAVPKEIMFSRTSGIVRPFISHTHGAVFRYNPVIQRDIVPCSFFRQMERGDQEEENLITNTL